MQTPGACQHLRRRLALPAALMTVLLSGCGGNDDPIFREINEEIKVDLKRLDMNRDALYPGESTRLEWRSSGALLFDARLYLSDDETLSSDDRRLVDEECGVEHDDHCSAFDEVTFHCRYESDNDFTCREDGDVLQRNNLTDYFPQLPFTGYLILEICGDRNCDTRREPITFY